MPPGGYHPLRLQYGQRTRGLHGLKKREEREIQRKGGKGKDKSGGSKWKINEGKAKQ